MTEQYYLNQGDHYCPPQIPSRYENYLDKNKYLSEFSTEYDKEVARYNLGVSEELQKLKNLIDTKVIERGNVAWDLVPIEGHTDRVLSSNSIYNALLNYTLNSEFNSTIQQLWTNVINKIDEFYNRIECEINDVNNSLREYIDNIKCEIDNLVLIINQKITIIDQSIEIFEQYKHELDELIRTLQEKIDSLEQLIIRYKEEIYTELYERIKNEDIDPMNEEIERLRDLVNTLVNDPSKIGLTDQFGDSSNLGIDQKTLTDALNRIWDKIEQLSGEHTRGIHMIVTPTFFTSEDGCIVNISAYSNDAVGIFEHIAFYANGELIGEADNVEQYTTQTEIFRTTEIKCVAKILGIEYTKTKTITRCSSFWLFAGNYNDSELETIISEEQHVIPITRRLRGAYDIDCNQGDYIYIIVGETLNSRFIRADLNSIEIPFNQSVITVNDNNYIVYKSVNTYNEGTYNIDING